MRACLRRNAPGPFQVQAAINAVHSDAPSAADTDWRQILALYDQLLALTPTPVVALNRAVALAEVDGPAAALAAVDASSSTPTSRSTSPGPTCSASRAPRRGGGRLRPRPRAVDERGGATVPRSGATG